MVDDARLAVEDQLVLAADQRTEGDRAQVVARALDDHALAPRPLALVVRRRGDVDHEVGAGERLLEQRRAGDPDVLADGQPDGHAVDLDQRAAPARLEVADLVEDAVVGQADLAVDRLHAAVGEDGGGVVDVVGPLGEADDGDDVARLARDVVERPARVAQEVLLEQQILGRVAGDRQLGEQAQLRAGVAGGAQAVLDLGRVAGEVADARVQLVQRGVAAQGGAGVPRSPHHREAPFPSHASANACSCGSSGPRTRSSRRQARATTPAVCGR